MKERQVLEGVVAFAFYKEVTRGGTYTFDHTKYQAIGGYWLESASDAPEVWVAYDFTSGNEVFIEEFSDKEEAIKYASGIIATTKSGQEI